jgi:hypothetical protein
MKIKTNIIFHLSVIVVLSLLQGCSAGPSKSTVEELIVKHFQGKQYKVMNLTIGEIRSMPLGEKQYMGTPGYDVDIPTITLRKNQDGGDSSFNKKEQEMTFNNVTVRIKQRSVRDREWVIASIEGISIPPSPSS